MPKKPQSLLGRFLFWRAKNIPQNRFVLILSVLVGLISGLVAVVLKNSTHYLQEFIKSDFLNEYFSLYYFAFPLIGIGL
ncbi:MAG: chloride channel protein, partial [Croceimicrobium sp.]